VSGAIAVGDRSHPAHVVVEPAGIAADALRIETPADDGGASRGTVVDFALTTSPDAAVGFDVRVDPASTTITWQIFLDDAPLPAGAVFAGPFGLPAVASKAGFTSDEARDEAAASALPFIDPSRDVGLFVVRDRPGGPAFGTEPARSPEANRETQRVLEQWGYAAPGVKKP
jgi:hypothetical protein